VASILASKKPSEKSPTRNQSGIALFMVIAAVSVLSILVTEFTYVAQVNQKIAFDGMDQLKAHYLAKTGLKLSLLRLKIFVATKQFVAGLSKGAGAGGKSMVPNSLLEKIWSFPFMYPIPTEIPGLLPADKDRIKAFTKASNLEGAFSAQIDSESGKYNLNMLLAGYAPKPSASPSPTPAPNGAANNGQPPAPAPSPQVFSPEEARHNLKTFMSELMRPKMEADTAWADFYRDPALLEDIVDYITAWADRTYEAKQSRNTIPMKKAPFYHVSELHMIPGMDDDLYELFAPNFTTGRTPGINVNTMTEPTLRALFADITEEEAKEFFKFRDSQEEDNKFDSGDKFLEYIGKTTKAYGNAATMDKLKEFFKKANIYFVTDETEFKITVKATLNQSSRLIEAWVSLSPQSSATSSGSGKPATGTGVNPQAANPNPQNPNDPGAPTGSAPSRPDPGLKITFMRII
jgi:general secretion pathway protein K